MTRPRRTNTSARQYPRTARLGELLREIVAEELERLDDPRLELVTVTGTRVDPDLKRATVWVSSLEGPERDPEVLEALGEHRARLQAAFARQARARWTPELVFRVHQIVQLEKPVHTHYYLKFLEEEGDVELREFFVIGQRSGIGIGAEVIQPIEGEE